MAAPGTDAVAASPRAVEVGLFPHLHALQEDLKRVAQESRGDAVTSEAARVGEGVFHAAAAPAAPAVLLPPTAGPVLSATTASATAAVPHALPGRALTLAEMAKAQWRAE